MKRLSLVVAIVTGCVVAGTAQQGGGTLPVTVPPLPTPDDVAAPPGWKPDGHIPPRMPLTLLRLPRTAITRARYPAIDIHVHAPDLTSDQAYRELVALLDRTGLGAICNMDGGTGAHLDAAWKAGAAPGGAGGGGGGGAPPPPPHPPPTHPPDQKKKKGPGPVRKVRRRDG